MVVCCLVSQIAAQTRNLCAGNPIDSVIAIGNPADCTRFTQCTGTTSFEMTCGPGMHFSALLGACDRKEFAGCVETGGPPTPPPSTPPVCSIDINYELVASQLRCDQFTVCACGHPHVETCANTLIFDTRTQRCDLPTVARCLTDIRNTPVCTHVGLVAHPHDCRHHFLCLGNGLPPILSICAPGLNFNSAINQCDRISCVLTSAPPSLLPRFAGSGSCSKRA